jgi:hypothetical protein
MFSSISPERRREAVKLVIDKILSPQELKDWEASQRHAQRMRTIKAANTTADAPTLPLKSEEASQAPVQPRAAAGNVSASGDAGHAQGRRIPDVETSRRRVELYNQLASELSQVQLWRKKNRRALSLLGLKAAFPNFALWLHIQESQQPGLLKDDIKPRAYAVNLVRAAFGLPCDRTSRAFLKKDRAVIRAAERA